MRRLAPPASICLGVACASCSSGVPADAGYDALMQLPGAQFVRGPMPTGSTQGPGVTQISLIANEIWPDLVDDPIGGALGVGATAAALGLQGDVGYWIVVAGVPNVATPDEPSFAASAAFSAAIVPGGNYTLVVQAVDQAGDFGIPSTAPLAAETSPTNPPPTGDLVVTLTWDTESSLDLHVVDPNGVEIYWGNPSSEPPPPFNQVDGGSYGYLDDDSNANCVIDGLRREDVIWPDPPPPGRYIVRVDTTSLCGQPIAYWSVQVVLEGQILGRAAGVAVDADTLGNHGLGAGVLALEFRVP
ncbi:MAG TPA: hypothetical protein VEK07_17175 [Polyangiaceae bacterium]|nr:hypothetical protein [Polyangiaceae bacterium]